MERFFRFSEDRAERVLEQKSVGGRPGTALFLETSSGRVPKASEGSFGWDAENFF